MYRHCIFCSAPLGANEAIEAFPVGRGLAFDPWKGRLWVVCPKCGRWNLTPLEERWEAVEEAEKRFVDARLRVQSENIGLARLPDGTRLIRVGRALPGELAAWRYGGQLVRRRRRYLLLAGAAGLGLAAWSGLAIAGVLGGSGAVGYSLYLTWEQKRRTKVVHRISPEDSPTGREALIRRWHVQGAYLEEERGGEVGLYVPDVRREAPETDWSGEPKYSTDTLFLRGEAARTVLRRALVHVNHKGASQRHIQDAVGLLSDARSAEEYLRRTARERGVLGTRSDLASRVLGRERALALEMALHEEAERRALEGELSLLTAAWREAEEIAEIADSLLDDPLARLRGR